MSLNRYEQTVFDYWEKQPDERRHWQSKVAAAARQSAGPGEVARALERELWEYFVERSQHAPEFQSHSAGLPKRVSLMNLAEHSLRLWGPQPKTPKKPADHIR